MTYKFFMLLQRLWPFKGLLHGSKIFLSNVIEGETAAVSGHILLGKDCEHTAHSQIFLRHLRHRALPARRVTRQVRTTIFSQELVLIEMGSTNIGYGLKCMILIMLIFDWKDLFKNIVFDGMGITLSYGGSSAYKIIKNINKFAYLTSRNTDAVYLYWLEVRSDGQCKLYDTLSQMQYQHTPSQWILRTGRYKRCWQSE